MTGLDQAQDQGQASSPDGWETHRYLNVSEFASQWAQSKNYAAKKQKKTKQKETLRDDYLTPL